MEQVYKALIEKIPVYSPGQSYTSEGWHNALTAVLAGVAEIQQREMVREAAARRVVFVPPSPGQELSNVP